MDTAFAPTVNASQTMLLGATLLTVHLEHVGTLKSVFSAGCFKTTMKEELKEEFVVGWIYLYVVQQCLVSLVSTPATKWQLELVWNISFILFCALFFLCTNGKLFPLCRLHKLSQVNKFSISPTRKCFFVRGCTLCRLRGETSPLHRQPERKCGVWIFYHLLLLRTGGSLSPEWLPSLAPSVNVSVLASRF